MKLSAVRRLALAGSLSASVALGLQLQHGRDARPFGASVAFAQPRAAGVAMLASPAEGRARLIDGKAIAAAVRRDIKASSDELKAAHGTTPGLAVVLVGNRTDSATYVRMKKKAAAEVGFYSVDRNFDETVTQEQLLATVEELNADPRIHGARSPRERAIRHYVVRGGRVADPSLRHPRAAPSAEAHRRSRRPRVHRRRQGRRRRPRIRRDHITHV